MKVVVITKPFETVLEERNTPKPAPDQILVKTRVSGISRGTELHMYDGTQQALRPPSEVDFPYGAYPAYPGYENVGEVVDVGKDVSGVSVGRRLISCAEHQEFACVPRRDALPLWAPIPDNVSDGEATLAILGTTALHCIHQSKIKYGDNVVVLGMGVVGMLAAQHARNAGAGKVIGVDPSRFRLRIAKEVGIEYTIDPSTANAKKEATELTDGLGADVVIEAVGSGGNKPTGVIRQAYELVRERGTVVMLGWHLSPSDVLFGGDPLIKEADLVMSRGTGPGDLPGEEPLENIPSAARWSSNRNLRFVVELLSKKKLNASPMITHTYKYTEISEVYRMMHEAKTDFLQVLLDWK